MAADFQNQHPNPCRLAKSGCFGSIKGQLGSCKWRKHPLTIQHKDSQKSLPQIICLALPCIFPMAMQGYVPTLPFQVAVVLCPQSQWRIHTWSQNVHYHKMISHSLVVYRRFPWAVQNCSTPISNSLRRKQLKSLILLLFDTKIN